MPSSFCSNTGGGELTAFPACQASTKGQPHGQATCTVAQEPHSKASASLDAQLLWLSCSPRFWSKEALHFHFALGLTDYVSGCAHTRKLPYLQHAQPVCANVQQLSRTLSLAAHPNHSESIFAHVFCGSTSDHLIRGSGRGTLESVCLNNSAG